MDTILAPLYYLVSWIMIGWHWLFSELIGINHDGVNWALSIIGLVVVIRILLIPLFVRQIKSQRKMQILQPQLRELQKKYKGDRERLQQEMMKLYKDTGTNPFASCLPILLQAPFLFALFRVLDGIAKGHERGAFTSQPDLFESAGRAEIFGARLADSFISSDNINTKIIAAVMVVLMVVTQFITQRQIMRKNMPKEALEGPFAQQQKILLYVLPLVFAFSGVYFPLGTVLYWLTSNFWTMGQQLYVIRRMPAPGTEAEKAHQRRLEEKARKKGVELPTPDTGTPAEPEQTEVVRRQPKKTTRSQRKKK
ncbi:membrane protein insertase YidC [Jiangella sp. DSM 45060]|uniref:membrane protein insertase YidC n=1 Tax=Jiangella sp. DSM 45060 TaxID=1798224 RepID=UPI00087A8394|nr:membrane protein insertase YidC [Jiangella sp. DSM 45060]SDT68867.1 YidC/Oxa1 family membrane protein insertase [Jiangella sp. DSM 45060]